MIACLAETFYVRGDVIVMCCCDLSDGHAGLHYDRRREYAWDRSARRDDVVRLG